MVRMKISVTTETCDLLEKHLPAAIAAKIKWGPVITAARNEPLLCLIECDPKDQRAIISTAEHHFPDKLSEVQEAFRSATRT